MEISYKEYNRYNKREHLKHNYLIKNKTHKRILLNDIIYFQANVTSARIQIKLKISLHFTSLWGKDHQWSLLYIYMKVYIYIYIYEKN